MTGGPAERHVVVGAGPAGLTAAWQLAQLGRDVVVLEADAHCVGGLARTLEHKGHRFDIGPHRFYTKSDAIAALWRRMLPDDFVEVRRLTRIYFDGQFLPYPLDVRATLAGIGWGRALRAGASWLAAQAFPRRDEHSFEDWVVNRFGHELYATFFKTYTEKVWGIPCAQINKDWAAQRIRGLSFGAVVAGALRGRGGPRTGEQGRASGPAASRGTGAVAGGNASVGGAGEVKSLIDRFVYPRRGAGQLWESVAVQVEARGGRVLLGRRAVALHHERGHMRAVTTADGAVHAGTHFHLTLTLQEFVNALDPPPPPDILTAGNALRHRDFITVALIVPRRRLFPDQWIYVHDPGVRVARITNYANWSAEMSPDPDTTAIGLEYFCNRGDALWNLSDAELLALAARELAQIGLAGAPVPPGAPGAAGGASANGAPAVGEATVPEGRVHRSLDAYPVYDDSYARHRETLKAWIAGAFDNVFPAGRKGLHNYNSQDHAMMTATLGVRNATEGRRFDVWSVNTDAEYAEEGAARGEIEERLVPRRLPPADGANDETGRGVTPPSAPAPAPDPPA